MPGTTIELNFKTESITPVTDLVIAIVYQSLTCTAVIQCSFASNTTFKFPLLNWSHGKIRALVGKKFHGLKCINLDFFCVLTNWDFDMCSGSESANF